MSQEGYDKAYALMEEIYENFSDEDKDWFLKENPAVMHLGLGMHIRNHAALWTYPWEPELIDGVDHSPNHPDAVSSKVIKDFQAEINLMIKEGNEPL
jgi:hypothetical protein